MASLGQPTAQAGPRQPEGGADAAQPPTMADPVSGPAQLLGGLWRTYGPGILASGAALLHSQTPQTAPASGGASLLSGFAAAAPPAQRPSMSGVQRATTQSVFERRRQLEAELASLPPTDELRPGSGSSSASESPERVIPTMQGTTSYMPTSPVGSDADLRARVAQYEEVEVPSDVEGYDLGGSPRPPASRPAASNRTSWFGWGAAPTTPEKNGKTE